MMTATSAVPAHVKSLGPGWTFSSLSTKDWLEKVIVEIHSVRFAPNSFENMSVIFGLANSRRMTQRESTRPILQDSNCCARDPAHYRHPRCLPVSIAHVVFNHAKHVQAGAGSFHAGE